MSECDAIKDDDRLKQHSEQGLVKLSTVWGKTAIASINFLINTKTSQSVDMQAFALRFLSIKTFYLTDHVVFNTLNLYFDK